MHTVILLLYIECNTPTDPMQKMVKFKRWTGNIGKWLTVTIYLSSLQNVFNISLYENQVERKLVQKKNMTIPMHKPTKYKQETGR